MAFTRRRFIRTALSVAASASLPELLRPARALAAPTRASDGVSATFDAVVGGRPLGVLPFAEEAASEPMEVAIGAGLDGRLYTDLTWTGPGTLETPVDRFFIRTRAPESLDVTAPWTIRVRGEVEKESTWSVDDLKRLGVKPAGAHVIECSGNGRVMHFGMLSAARFDGVPVTELLKQSRPKDPTKRVVISGFDEHSKGSANSEQGASWVFTPEQLEGAIFATAMNGQPLVRDHGAPVRLLMPGWYGCTCIKWVNDVRWVGHDELATLQMMEFAERTHQNGKPALARDYKSAAMDQAAMPVRVEKWNVGGKLVYRVVGITWGGAQPSTKLVMRAVTKLPSDAPFQPVAECGPRGPGRPWAMWSALWQPKDAGTYAFQLLVNEPTLVTRRLKTGFYTRTIKIDEV